jgi:hypothetical protein
MLRDARQYRQAIAEIHRLKGLPKDLATSTRIREGTFETLCFEWEEEGRESKPLTIVPSLPDRDPRAIACADWYERNAHRLRKHWADAFEDWIAPLNLEPGPALALYEDYSDEMWSRYETLAAGEDAA